MRAPTLTPEQEDAVAAGPGAWLLVAPPGSGKTEVLIRRAIHLLEDSPGELFRVLTLTFTERAANELRERAREALGEESWRVEATTFHAFCLDLLRHYGDPVGVAPDVCVYDDDLRAELLIDALREGGWSLPESVDARAVRDALARIDRLRVDLQPPDLAPESPLFGGALTLREAYQTYEQALDTVHALDFDGMLLRGQRLLMEDPWVGQHLQRQYRYVLVDEAQDLNLARYETLAALCGDDLRDIFVVADSDQELFGFTGASSAFLDRYERDFGAKRLDLTTNFRSATRIISVAEDLRGHLETGSGAERPPMEAQTAALGWVGAWSLPTPEAEAEAIAKWVTGLLDRGLPPEWLHEGEDPRLTPEDVCVMARTRFAFDPLAGALEAGEVPYSLRTEEGGLFDSTIGLAVYWGLRLAANPRDAVSARRLMALEGNQAALVSEESPGVARVVQVLETLKARGVLPEEVAGHLAEAARQPESAHRVVEHLVSEAGEVASLPTDRDEHEATLWEADRRQLGTLWQRYAATTRHDERSLAGFLRLLGRLQRTVPDEPGVRLLTPYRAKGLQFRVVAIVGMNEGTFPYYKALGDSQKIAAERRSAYVAVTRAARGLLLTRPEERRTFYGNIRRDSVSRFVEEMGLTMTTPVPS